MRLACDVNHNIQFVSFLHVGTPEIIVCLYIFVAGARIRGSPLPPITCALLPEGDSPLALKLKVSIGIPCSGAFPETLSSGGAPERGCLA